MSKKTKFTQHMGFAMLKGVLKTKPVFDALNLRSSFLEPIPATPTSLLPTAEPSGPVQPLSFNTTSKSSFLSAHPVSLSSIIVMTLLLVLPFSPLLPSSPTPLFNLRNKNELPFLSSKRRNVSVNHPLKIPTSSVLTQELQSWK